MTGPYRIDVASNADESAIVCLLTMAFGVDPPSRWIWGRAHHYLEHFPRFIRVFAGEAFARGTAYHAVDGMAAALWLPPGAQPERQALEELTRNTVPADLQADYLEAFEQMERHHPAGPHWYLALIGIDPSRQGRGYGSALLKHGLSICDRDQLPAYLESSNPRNIPFYERQGFVSLGVIQPGDAAPLFPMLREAR